MANTCACGSGMRRVPQYDARGIFLTFTCDTCHDGKMAGFRPEVLNDPDYAADDLGDDEGLGGGE